MSYRKSIRDEYYGVPLWYRVEHRKAGDVIVVSYRDERGRIQHEADPVGGEKAAASLHMAEEGGALQYLPEDDMVGILRKWIGLHTLEGCSSRKAVPELTLGVLLMADKQELLYETGSIRSESTVKDDERAFRAILERWGETPWREVTPEMCAE